VNLGEFFTGSNIADKTAAFIGSNGTTKTTSGDITVKAEEKTTINASSGAASAGGAALGGSVVVITLNGTIESYTGGSIQADKNLNITAQNNIYANNLRTVGGSAGVIGLGGSVVVLNITGTTKAYAGGTLNVSGSINIHALGRIEANGMKIYAGGVGGLGLGAAVGIVNISSIAQAYMANGTRVENSGNISIKADFYIIANVDAIGTAAGVISAGATIARVNVTANVSAYTGTVTIVKADNIDIMSYITADIMVSALAAAGGILSGAGAEASITFNPAATAYLTGNVQQAAGDVKVNATVFITRLIAESKGTAAALGATAGVSLAKISITPDIRAYIGAGTINTDGNVYVRAYYNLNGTASGGSISARAYAGSGAVLVGVNGANAEIVHRGSVKAYISGQIINSRRDVNLQALGYQDLIANGGGVSGAGIAAVGGVVVSVTNEPTFEAYIENSNITALGDISINAVRNGSIKAEANGTSGGLLVAGTAQSVTINEKVTVKAYVSGNGYTLKSTGSDIVIASYNDSSIIGRAQGYAVSGFASGGQTSARITVNNASNVLLYEGVKLDAYNDVFIDAQNHIRTEAYSSASAGAIGGSSNDVVSNTAITLNTGVDVKASVDMRAGRNITILAGSDKYYYAYSTAVVGGIIAKGVAKSEQTVSDTVKISIGNSSKISADGYVYINTVSQVPSGSEANMPVSRAVGGAGGAASGTHVLSRLDATVNSSIVTGSNVDISSASNDVTLLASAMTAGRLYSKIKFTVSGLNQINTEARSTNNIYAVVTLGSGTRIKGTNVTIHGEVSKIDIYAEAYSETGAVINTQSRPYAYLSTIAEGKVEGVSVKLEALEKLGIYATVDNIILRTYSYGYTAGGTGSVISTSENNVNIRGTISIRNSDSELKGMDIEIKATSPRQNESIYVKDAAYKADTVTEFVSKTVTKVIEVVEKVTEKVVKYLPWPLNKIVKWVVKTVTRLVEITVTVLVEVVLQSETDAITKGSYTASNNIELYGHIYYGAGIPIEIIIDKDGNINNVPGLEYVKDNTRQTITIKPFVSKAAGSLVIDSYVGTVTGNVVVHSNSIIKMFTIVNQSNYHLIINDISLASSDNDDSNNYQIICAVNNLNMEDTTDIVEVPVISITSTQKTNITFNGRISHYSAILRVITSGNVYMTGTGLIEVNEIEIDADNIGRSDEKFVIHAFSAEDRDGKDINPKISLKAEGNIYVTIYLRKYVDNSENTVDIDAISIINGGELVSVNAGGTVSITLAGAELLVGEKAPSEGSLKYTYEKEEMIETLIEEIIAPYVDYNKTLIEHELYPVFLYNEETGAFETRYYLDIEYTQLYKIPEGYRIIYEKIEDEEEGYRYYLVLINPKSGFRYVGGEKDGQEYEYDKENSIIIYNEEEGRYYLVTTKVVIVEEELPDTTESEGVAVKLYYRDGKYYVGQINGVDIDLTATSYTGYKTILELTGDITADNTLVIRALDKGDIIISGTVAANGPSLNINAGSNDIEIVGNGQIIGNTASTNVNISAGSVRTNKSQADRFDVSGKQINITVSNGLGSQENPVAVNAGTDGLKVLAGNGSSVYVQNYLAPLYVVQIETSGSAYIWSEKPVYAGEQSSVNISAGSLDLTVRDGSIGQAKKMLVVSITDQISARAAGDIYLKQVSSSVLVRDLTSEEGSIVFAADKDIVVVKVEAKDTVTIKVIDGSILNGADSGYVVKGNNIVLESGNAIGTSLKPLAVYIESGILTAVSMKDAYISQLGGDVTVDSIESREGSAAFDANGDIAIGVIKAPVSITVRSDKGLYSILNDDINVYSKNITLSAGNLIGSSSKPLVVFLTGGMLKAGAAGDIFIVNKGNEDITVEDISSNNGDITFETNSKASIYSMSGKNITVIGEKELNLKDVSAENKVYINSISGLGIFGLNNQEATGHIRAAQIVLLAAGSVGTGSNYLLTELKDSGKISASAENDIFIKNLSAVGITVEELISSSGEIAFISNADTLVKHTNAAGNITITVNSGNLSIERITSGNTAEVNVTAGSLFNTGESGANIEASVIVLNIAREVGASDKYIYTDMANDGIITVIAAEDVFVHELLGDMRISKIHTNGDVYLNAQGSILNADADEVNISGRNLILNSLTGTIGLPDALLTIMTSEGGHIRANTINKGIYIESVAGDLIVDWINAGNSPVVLSSAGSVIDGLEDESQPNIIASDLIIRTISGDIGVVPFQGKDRAIRTELTNGSRLDIDAGGSVYLRELTGDLRLGIITVRGNQFELTVPGNIFTALTKEDILAGRANITAKEVILISLHGSIGEDSVPNTTYFDEDYAGWITTSILEGYELSARAEGDIYIREISGSLLVGVVESVSGNVSLSAYMDVKSINKEGSPRINVIGKDIYVETTNGIISINVEAKGDAVLNAADSITNLRQEGIYNILISGNNITLISRNGGVGQEDSYIDIDTDKTGILNVYANLGVYIREIRDSLTIGRVISITGNVELEVPDGDILGIVLNETNEGTAEFVGNDSSRPAHVAGKNIKLVSLTGGIGKSDNYLAVDSDGRTVLLAAADIYVEEIAGDMVLELVKTDGNIYLISDGSILAADDAAGIIVSGEDITLTAVNGGIGNAEKALAIDLDNAGVLRANAAKNIYLDAAAGDMRIFEINTPESVWLRALGSITTADNAAGIIVSGEDITLTAINGGIGSAEKAFAIDLGNAGVLRAYAANNIYLDAAAGDMRIFQVHTPESVWLRALGSIFNEAPEGTVNVSGKELVLTALEGYAGTRDKALVVDTESDHSRSFNGYFHLRHRVYRHKENNLT
jgi:hypothetical protein